MKGQRGAIIRTPNHAEILRGCRMTAGAPLEMCALTTLCSVCCVVSIKQTQRLQTGLYLCDRNAIITSKWKGCYDFDRKYRSEWERLLCRKQFFFKFRCVCDKGMAIPQKRLFIFWPLNRRFGLFLVAF